MFNSIPKSCLEHYHIDDHRKSDASKKYGNKNRECGSERRPKIISINGGYVPAMANNGNYVDQYSESNQPDSDWHWKNRPRQMRMGSRQSYFSEKQPKASHHESEPHQRDASPNPGKKGPFCSHVDA